MVQTRIIIFYSTVREKRPKSTELGNSGADMVGAASSSLGIELKNSNPPLSFRSGVRDRLYL